ncbi:hypothetical protein F0562_021057 [Nyssa sinensis]|uniref:RRM domain-containing protein n=1 Tax=Nyssa sinensis TaxID=561372 RepID=A0A5J5BLA5_9ASTE|nr:hypothetical protein F0562_021057 [Nyssa sinensis]
MHWSNGIRLSAASRLTRWLIQRHSHSKLFVGGLSYDTNETVLKDAFGLHSEIIEVKVICDQCKWKIKRIWVCAVRFRGRSQ